MKEVPYLSFENPVEARTDRIFDVSKLLFIFMSFGLRNFKSFSHLSFIDRSFYFLKRVRGVNEGMNGNDNNNIHEQ